jgi:chromosome segregation ATPase
MIDDLVERLRERSSDMKSRGHVTLSHLHDEAADEITALRARLEAVEKDRDEWVRDVWTARGFQAEAEARAERAEAALATARADALAPINRNLIAETIRPSLHEPYGQILAIADDVVRVIQALKDAKP